MADSTAGPYIGRAMKRVEDPRLLRGIGTYTDDLRLPGLLHAVILRSPHAHARVRTRMYTRVRVRVRARIQVRKIPSFWPFGSCLIG